MGVWGIGLYSGDFAKDLSSAARAISQLPFDGDELAELLCSAEPGAAYNSADEDHTTFWLVIADQFAKKGIACNRVREKALEIIDSGADLESSAGRGMNTAGLNKRKKILSDLRDKIRFSTPSATPRRVLKMPQPLLMNAGDVLVYPTARGHQINPYFPSAERIKPEWIQDGWGAAVIVEVGREFDFLAWYRPMTIAHAMSAKPDLQKVLANETWVLRLPGTCSASHFRKMRMEKAGVVAI